MLDVVPLTLMKDGVYVSGRMLSCWPNDDVNEIFDFINEELDRPHGDFVRSLAWRGPSTPP